MKELSIFLLLLVSSIAQGQTATTIKVIVPNSSDEVYIAGNQQNLGDWQADKVKMKIISEYEREITTNLSFPAELKFTRGSWESEAIMYKFENGENIKIEDYSPFKAFVVDHWRDDTVSSGDITIKYNIHYVSTRFYPNEERMLAVCLPPNYKSDKKYPVVYTLDARSLFEPLVHSLFVLQSQADEGGNVIPECIAVGIFNNDRRRDFSPNTGEDATNPVGRFNKGAELFFQSIQSEILPLINQTYSTSGFDAVIGHSDAGHFVTQAYLDDANPFDATIALSVNDFGNYFQDALISKLSADSTNQFFLGFGKRDDEFNVLGNYIISKKVDLSNFEVREYNTGHVDLPPASLTDALKFTFSHYKNYDGLIAKHYNDKFNYGKLAQEYTEKVENIYGIKDTVGYEIYYLLNRARDQGNVQVFHSLLDHVDSTEIYQLQVRFYAASEFHQVDRARDYLYQMLKSDDETDKLIFKYNLRNQYKDFFLEEMNDPKELISFIEQALEKWPDYTLEFKYLIVNISKEENLNYSKVGEYIKYLNENYRNNDYFTFQELQDLQDQ